MTHRTGHPINCLCPDCMDVPAAPTWGQAATLIGLFLLAGAVLWWAP